MEIVQRQHSSSRLQRMEIPSAATALMKTRPLIQFEMIKNSPLTTRLGEHGPEPCVPLGPPNCVELCSSSSMGSYYIFTLTK